MNNETTISGTACRSVLIEKGDVLTLHVPSPAYGIDIPERIFIASGGGFGCNPKTGGSAVFGHWQDTGSDDRIERHQVTSITKGSDWDEIVKEKLTHQLESLKGSLEADFNRLVLKIREGEKINPVGGVHLMDLQSQYDQLSKTINQIIIHHKE